MAVESLLVIANNAILAGLLLPEMSKAKLKGQQAACTNHINSR